MALWTATLGSSCVWVGMRRMEACVVFEQEGFYAWETWKSVSWPLERSALWETLTAFSSVEAKVRGCSVAG